MPKKLAAKFQIEHLQILDEEGEVDEKLMPELDTDTIQSMYEEMVRGRRFDETALKLQREGRMGTYASIQGQEASNIGPAFALEDSDWVFPAFRENGLMITRGMPMHKQYQYWGWDERGMDFSSDTNLFTISVPVGTQGLHGVGFAWAQKLKGTDVVTATFFGDGATSKGDMYEAWNFAGAFRLPIVFINQNNQYAISVPRNEQTGAETLAQKAIATGFEGVQVDGNDIFAVYKATKDAVEKARRDGGPTYIECLTYRLQDHTTADDAKKYRDPEEVEKWRKRDPIERLKKYMVKQGIWNEGKQKELEERVEKEIKEEVEKYENQEPSPVEDIFDHMYGEMTPRLEEQLEYLKESMEETGQENKPEWV